MMKAEAAGSLPKTNAEAVRKKPGRKRYGWMKGLLLPAVIIAIWQVIGGLGGCVRYSAAYTCYDCSDL